MVVVVKYIVDDGDGDGDGDDDGDDDGELVWAGCDASRGSMG